jgi:hypothetical protein
LKNIELGLFFHCTLAWYPGFGIGVRRLIEGRTSSPRTALP